MFSELLTRLTQPRPLPLPDTDARLALAALLVRVAKSDNNFAFEEVRQIDRILAERYGLSPVAAAKLRAQAQKMEPQAPATADFARSVKAAVPYADRSAVVVALWSVIVSDGAEKPEEAVVLAEIAGVLGVSTEDLEKG